MSIHIDTSKCIGCGLCLKVCPGNLLIKHESKAMIKYPKDCWGCTACVKECQTGAISYFLGPDIGGKGTRVFTTQKENTLEWHFIRPNNTQLVISVNRKEANKY